MASPLVERLLGRAKWWDGPAGAVANLVNAALRPARLLQGILNGAWLGHPIHPMTTDVAIGAWTGVLVLDLWGLTRPEAGVGTAAAVLLWLGVLAAAISILSGLTDWKDTYGFERRVGFVHGLVMITVSLLYVISGIMRLTGPIDGMGARVVGFVGFLGVVAGGYLGGELAFGFGSMVDHNAFRDPVPTFTPVASLADLPVGMTGVEAKGRPVLLVREGDTVRAIGDVCSHAGGPLHEGTLERDVVTCPWHGSRFRVDDGSVVRSPATFPQPGYEVRIREGSVEVRSRRV